MFKSHALLGISILGLASSFIVSSPARADANEAQTFLRQMEKGYRADLDYQEVKLAKLREKESRDFHELRDGPKDKSNLSQRTKKTQKLVREQDLIKKMEGDLKRSRQVLLFLQRLGTQAGDSSIGELRRYKETLGEAVKAVDGLIRESRNEIKEIKSDRYLSLNESSDDLVEENKSIEDLKIDHAIFTRQSELISGFLTKLAAPSKQVDSDPTVAHTDAGYVTAYGGELPQPE